MISNATIDADTIKRNCAHYSKRHYKAIEVLKRADGKNDYKKIAKDLDLHKTIVSGLLRAAENLGLATRNEAKVYRKIPGILQYMPRIKALRNKRKISEITEIIEKRKSRLPVYKEQNAFGVNFRDNPEKMAKGYVWLYITENILRELIRHVFQAEQEWWSNRVNDGIRKDVQKTMNEYPYDGAKRRDELEYTHLGQLKEIITASKNWNMFLPFLNETDKNSFQVTIDKAIPSRNSLGHCTPLTAEDFRFVDIRFKDILKMIKD